jgi:integrase
MAARAERDRILGAQAQCERVQANPKLRFREASDSYLTAFEARTELRESTRADTRRVVERHLLPRFHTRRLDGIEKADVMALLAALRSDGLGERSCALVLAVLGRIYRHAAADLRWAGRNPVDLLARHERPKPSHDRKRPIFDGDDLDQTVAAATEPYRTLFKLLAGTGARISETLAVRWSDLYLNGDDPRVAFRGQVDRKGERRALKRRDNGIERVVPIPAGLAKVLRGHVARSSTPGEYAFATSTGRPLGQRNVARALRGAQRRATRPDGSTTYPQLHEDTPPERGEVPGLHSFRHTAATRFLYAGDSADEVAVLLGHRDATVTRAVYLHEVEDAARRAIRRDRINAEFGSVFEA